MPTAISIVENEDGFAVASDSAYYDMATGTAAPNYIQKIFPVDRSDLSIAYCLCGIVTFAAIDKHGQPPVFSLFTEVPRILTAMDKMATLHQFAEAFGKRLCTRLRKATNPLPANKPSETYVFLFGYYNGLPGLEIVEISRDANPLECTVFPGNAPYNIVTACFPGAVRDHFYSDPVFEPFRAKDCPHSGIQAALEIARQSVLACYDPEVRSKYPEAGVVGGPIHVAKITRAGFEWIEPPESVAI
ncbi:MAG: hypothetical protein ABSG65_33105 [Bryobacteraceae bacterium]|jgi:hypothetical protein